MKIIVVLTLYFMGAIVFNIWRFGDKERFKEFNEDINKNPELASLPENILRAMIFIGVFILSFLWPYYLIKALVKAFKNLFK